MKLEPGSKEWYRLKYVRESVTETGLEVGSNDWEIKVLKVLDAWLWAEQKAVFTRFPGIDEISTLAIMISNTAEYRKSIVNVGGVNIGVRNTKVEAFMKEFVEEIPELTPNEVYYYFLKIAPYEENEPIAVILFNWQARTLSNPIHPMNPEER